MGLFSKKPKHNFFKNNGQSYVKWLFKAGRQEASIVFQVENFGKQVAVYPNYNRVVKNIGQPFVATELDELYEDLEKLFEFVNQSLNEEDPLLSGFDKFILFHIQKYRRLIDNDLFGYINRFVLIYEQFIAIPNRESLSKQDKESLFESLMKIYFQKHESCIYVTKYNSVNGELKAEVVKLTDINIEKNQNAKKSQGFTFDSSDHRRFENGVHVSGPHGGACRRIKLEPNIEGGPGYTVSIYNMDGNAPQIQMSPKQMRVKEKSENIIKLIGFGNDANGFPFDDYGLTIHHNSGKIEKCILHMIDRNVDIEYLK